MVTLVVVLSPLQEWYVMSERFLPFGTFAHTFYCMMHKNENPIYND